jgi:endonuclease/exonuclease/phosphatase family metal-dependent hydrolase
MTYSISHDQGDALLLATYNIHYGLGADGAYDVARVADAVAEADVACLQEVVCGWPQNGHADQAAEIGGRLNRYWCYHGAMDADASTVDGAAATGATWDGTGPDDFMFHDSEPAIPSPAIVAGDMNFTPQLPEYSKVIATGLADAWRAAGNEEVESYPGEGRIDHVFATSGLAPRITRAWIGLGNPASDHWPVFVQFDP